MPLHSTYKAIVARAQAEVKNRSSLPLEWPPMVAAAVRCAIVVEGPESEAAQRGTVCLKLCIAMVKTIQTPKGRNSQAPKGRYS